MTINGNTITADENKILTNGTVRSRKVILGGGDRIDNWSETDMTEGELSDLRAEKAKEATEKIEELKEHLALTDYKAIKFAEGWISKEEYAPVKALRQALREEINRLENT